MDEPAERDSRGSTLLLFPAAILIVIALAAITVDASIAFLGERELANATAAAANDAAAQALDDRAFYQGNRIELDQEAVERVAEERVLDSIDGERHRQLEVEATAVPPARDGCPWTVRVRASASVNYLFAAAIPGGPRQVRLEATSVATPRQAADPQCESG